MTHINRARELNRMIARDRARQGVVIYSAYASAFALCMLVGGYIGLNAPMPETGKTYALLTMHGDETDIADYNLTMSDCQQEIVDYADDGISATCRTESKR